MITAKLTAEARTRIGSIGSRIILRDARGSVIVAEEVRIYRAGKREVGRDDTEE
jgi:hypothetical protein